MGKTCRELEKAAADEAPRSTKPLQEGLERGGDAGDGATLSSSPSFNRPGTGTARQAAAPKPAASSERVGFGLTERKERLQEHPAPRAAPRARPTCSALPAENIWPVARN